jgi:transposase-like protein
MSARRLNDSEKQEIIALYRQSGETTISLADRFGVSNSTIGRVVKNGMENTEYDALVQQKRGRNVDPIAVVMPAAEAQAELAVAELAVTELAVTAAVADQRPRLASIKPKPRVGPQKKVIAPIADDFDDDLDDDFEADPADPEYLALAAELGSVASVDEAEEDEDEDFDDDGDFDEEEDDDDDFGGERLLPRIQIERDHLTVLPLADAAIPKVFYLVVDRGAELIAPPLRDFGELGEMSSDEAENRTLPLFDNHRVAKRFSNVRTQRVIKVPDNRLFYKTTRHLSAKGIKRFLLDGQVYTLV